MSLQESMALIQQQVQILFILLARPIVQRQLLAVVVILLMAWALPFGARAWSRSRGSPHSTPQSKLRSQVWLERFYLILAPLMALLFNSMAVAVLVRSSHPYGILYASQGLIWAWLVYRVVLAILYGRYGAKVKPYHHWVLLPLFLWLVTAVFFQNFVNTQLLAEIPIITILDTTITLGNLSAAIVALYWFIVASWLVEGAIRGALSKKSTVEAGVVESVVTVSRYVVLLAGVMLSLNYLGMDLSTLAIIGGGLSIGVGFGLQSIVASFISGLVLLFEQSLLPGDVIDIHGDIGTVERVNMRSTTVRTIDNVEVVVPNDLFLSTEVMTFTKTDNDIRVLIPFGVSYSSNPHEVRTVVLNAVSAHSLVLIDPEPQLLFRGYGDSSLDFELAVWIDQPERARRVSSDLYYMIWDAFAETGIEIPFPQRDLNLGKGWDKVAAT